MRRGNDDWRGRREVETHDPLCLALWSAPVWRTHAGDIDKSKLLIIDLYQIGPWIVQSELDPKTDKPFVIVQTPLDSKAGPYLEVNCEEGKPYIAFGIPGARWNKDEEVS